MREYVLFTYVGFSLDKTKCVKTGNYDALNGLDMGFVDSHFLQPNFNIVNDNFITYDFGDMKFDMIYSVATIQCIPEPLRTEFFEGPRKAVLDTGDRIVFIDTYVLYITKKT